MTDIRVTQSPVEIAAGAAADARVSQLATEIAWVLAVVQRVTQVAVEIASKNTEPPITIGTDPTGGGTVGAGTDPAAGLNLCPVEVPIAWVEITPAGSSTIYRYAKVPINVGSAQKEPRVESFGLIRRALSNNVGDFRGVSVTTVLIDTDRVLRGLEDNDSLIGARISYYLSSEVAIRAGSTPRRVFDGLVTDTEPLDGLRFSIQAADYFASLMDEAAAKRTFPQRVFSTDDFPYLANPQDTSGVIPGNPGLIGKPVPIGYGKLSDEALGSEATGVVPASFVGQRYLDGFWWDEWVVFGHAAPGGIISTFGGMPTSSFGGTGQRFKTTEDIYGVDIVAPGHAYWATVTGSTNLYRDYNGNRYTVFYARGPRSYAAQTGSIPWAVNVGGCEDVGDGTGLLIDGLFRQILHLFTNFVFGNYTSGAWLSPPVVPGDLYSRIKTSTLEALQTLSALYVASGFQGAFVLGADGATRTLPELLRTAAVSGGFDYGINKEGQLIASMINPGAAMNRAIVDVTDTIARSFRARRRRDLLKNTIKYRYAQRYVQPVTRVTPAEGTPLPAANPIAMRTDWTEATPLTDGPSTGKYGERVLDLEMAFVRDATTADAVVGLALAALKTGPTIAGFKERLCGTGTDLGDRDTLTHFEGVTATGYTARSMRCESHTLDLDGFNIEKDYRDLTPIDYSALEI
jgi:hypothetical protein